MPGMPGMPGILEDSMDLSSREAEAASSSSLDSSQSYQLFTTDDHGNLRVSCPPQEGRILLAISPKKKGFAVQKMAKGTLANGMDVLALARRSGQIDIVTCSEGKVIATFRQPDMRDGIHRWVGLAVAQDGIYSCTSAGAFRYTPLLFASESITLGTVVNVSLPEPLQQLVFEPESDPKFFAFGGEEVPLSVWDAQKAITQPSVDSSPHTPGSEDNGGDGESGRGHTKQSEQDVDGPPSSKDQAAKRKRVAEGRAKSKEFLWGEVWRAKNLPNDALGLQRRAGILCIAFLEETKLAVGTKAGWLRLYEVGPQRKHKKEVRLFHPKVAPVKIVIRSHNVDELIASDTLGRVYVVNWRSATILYKYLAFSGAVVSMCSMPSARSGKKEAHLATASAEKLLRMHGMPVSSQSLQKSKENGRTKETQFFQQGVNNVIWDGRIPQTGAGDDDTDEVTSGARTGADEVPEGQDDIWQGMATIDDDADEVERLSQRRRIE